MGHSALLRVSSISEISDVLLFLQLFKPARPDVPIPTADRAASELPFLMKFLRLLFMIFRCGFSLSLGVSNDYDDAGVIQIS